jgi:hypothetical protein
MVAGPSQKPSSARGRRGGAAASARPELRPATPLRVPPHNVDAERSVLGALLLVDAPIHDVARALQAEDFYLDAHADLFRAMLQLVSQGTPIDTLTLADELERQGSLQRVGGMEAITSLAASVPTAANVEHYARIVRDHSLRRQLIAAAGSLADLGFDDSLGAEGAIEEAQHAVSEVVDRHRSRSDDAELAVTAAALCADETQEAESIVPGVLPAGSITEVAGPVKGGKTTLEMAAAKAIVSGGEFLGGRCRQGPVVLISEESRPTLRAALRRAGLADCADLHVIYGMATRRRPWPETAAAAVSLAEQMGAVALFVDTLTTLAGLGAEEENDAGAAMAAILPLRVAADLGLGVWISRHDRKGGGPLGESGRGSSAFAGAVDSLFTLRRVEGALSPNVRRLQGVSRFDDCLTELDIEWTEDGYVSRGDPATHAAQSQESALVSALPVGVADAAPSEKLAEAVTGLSVRRAKEKLEDLHHRNQIGRAGEGKKGDPHRYYAFYPQERSQDPEFPAEFPADPTYKEESAPNPILEFPADDFSQETQESLPSVTAPEFLATGAPPKGGNPPSAGNVSGGADHSGRDRAHGRGDKATAPGQPMPEAASPAAHTVAASAPAGSPDEPPLPGDHPRHNAGADAYWRGMTPAQVIAALTTAGGADEPDEPDEPPGPEGDDLPASLLFLPDRSGAQHG